MTTFRIFGQVIDQKTRQGLAALLVEAWDKDLIGHDLVGSSVTDEQGAFQIRFDESHFRELFLDRRPDLFFKIFNSGNLIESTEDSVLWNVAAGDAQITIEIKETIVVDTQTQPTVFLNQNLIDIATLNPDLGLTPAQFTDLVANTIVVIRGCITSLRYGSSDTDLTYVSLTNPLGSLGVPGTSASTIVENLNDFRERLQEAANFGHRVDACYNKTTRKIFMLNIRPCRCLCDRKDEPNPPIPTIPPVFTAS